MPRLNGSPGTHCSCLHPSLSFRMVRIHCDSHFGPIQTFKHSPGVLTLQPTSQARTKAAGLVRHQLAMIGLGIPLALLGFLAVFFTKIANDKAHFTSWHGVRSSSHLFLYAYADIQYSSSVSSRLACWPYKLSSAVVASGSMARCSVEIHRLSLPGSITGA